MLSWFPLLAEPASSNERALLKLVAAGWNLAQFMSPCGPNTVVPFLYQYMTSVVECNSLYPQKVFNRQTQLLLSSLGNNWRKYSSFSHALEQVEIKPFGSFPAHTVWEEEMAALGDLFGVLEKYSKNP